MRPASTPFLEVKAEEIYAELEEAEKAGSNAVQGALKPHAAKITMKLLFAARMMR